MQVALGVYAEMGYKTPGLILLSLRFPGAEAVKETQKATANAAINLAAIAVKAVEHAT